jgi:hypothetical protein
VQVAFKEKLDFRAAAVVSATRGAPLGRASGPPPRDLLLLHPNGTLSLYIGARHVCNISIRAPPSDNADPYAALTEARQPAVSRSGAGSILDRQ